MMQGTEQLIAERNPQRERRDSDSEMAVLGLSGDTKLIWDKNRPEEVENARRTFNDLRAKKYLGFRVTGKDGEKGEQMNEFDPNAERLIMIPPFQGG